MPEVDDDREGSGAFGFATLRLGVLNVHSFFVAEQGPQGCCVSHRILRFLHRSQAWAKRRRGRFTPSPLPVASDMSPGSSSIVSIGPEEKELSCVDSAVCPVPWVAPAAVTAGLASSDWD